jgi:hypothetical protein
MNVFTPVIPFCAQAALSEYRSHGAISFAFSQSSPVFQELTNSGTEFAMNPVDESLSFDLLPSKSPQRPLSVFLYFGLAVM